MGFIVLRQGCRNVAECFPLLIMCESVHVWYFKEVKTNDTICKCHLTQICNYHITTEHEQHTISSSYI